MVAVVRSLILDIALSATRLGRMRAAVASLVVTITDMKLSVSVLPCLLPLARQYVIVVAEQLRRVQRGI